LKDLLVGSTGFVGGNLLKNHTFSATCHSSDITEYYDSNPELCIYAGVPSEMFTANSNPEKDLEIIETAFYNITRINPKKLVLISSIAVYSDSRNKTEDSPMEYDNLPAYGKNRLKLENLVHNSFPNALIIRLPALYGHGLKKNFLFDLHTITPSLLKPEKYFELIEKNNLIKDNYTLQDNGFYKLSSTAPKKELKDFFKNNDFNSLAFTDSRSKYQFYNLNNLWNDIKKALEKNITLLNITTPPISTATVYKAVTGKDDWVNELPKAPFDYNLKTKYSNEFGGQNGYLCTVEDELKDICEFMSNWKDI